MAARDRGIVKVMLEPDDGHLDERTEPFEAHADPAPIQKFRHTAIGSVLAAGMLGLRDVFEPPKDEEPAIVVDWAGEPPFADPLVLRLDPDHPQDSIVMVRPWLRAQHDPRRHD
jgi:hypothetical protein